MSTPTVDVNPQMLRWAIARSRIPEERLRKRIPRLTEWERGQRKPTLRQLEDFARQTRTPFGFLLLSEPPEEGLPIPDFRTRGDVPIDQPSPELIDTVQRMQQRQAWMREYVSDLGQESLPFVGSAANRGSVAEVAADIRHSLELEENWAANHPTWEAALRQLRDAIDARGILVAINSVVGNNNRRPLDPHEFRGFVLIDQYAPLLFVNGADYRAAQMFTLAHELAHVWRGSPALFNLIELLPHDSGEEQFCNRVAAEFLLPRGRMLALWRDARRQANPFLSVARTAKVSSLVAARRALDLELINRRQFFEFYQKETRQLAARQQQQKERSHSGDFYRTAAVRIGRRFGEAVVCAVREGKLLYRDAYRLTGLKGSTFERFAQHVREGLEA